MYGSTAKEIWDCDVRCYQIWLKQRMSGSAVSSTVPKIHGTIADKTSELVPCHWYNRSNFWARWRKRNGWSTKLSITEVVLCRRTHRKQQVVKEEQINRGHKTWHRSAGRNIYLVFNALSENPRGLLPASLFTDHVVRLASVLTSQPRHPVLCARFL